MHTTTRLGLQVPDGTDNESGFPAVDAQAKGILDNSILVTEGTIAARPAANTFEHNHLYRATDTNTWYVSDGTNWNVASTPQQGTAANRPTAGVFGRVYSETDTGLVYLDTGSTWAAMVPSSGSVTGAMFTPNINTTWSAISNPSPTVACTGSPLLALAGPISVQLSSPPIYTCLFGFSIDGGTPTPAGNIIINTTGGQNTIQTITPMAVLTPSRGSHTITLQQRLDTAATTITFPSYLGQIVITQL